jgi:hypothetical protein
MASVAPADIDNGSSDNFGIVTRTVNGGATVSFDCTDVGPNNVTLGLADQAGNTSSCVAVVTVEDNIAPTALCQNITVQLNASGSAAIVAGDIDNGSNDACGIADLSLDISTFTCADVGPNTVTLTAEDNHGNTAQCTATVTVEDNIAPTALCQDITVQLDSSGNASIVAGDIDNGSSDACGIASLSLDIDTFTCADVGPNTVTLTVEDNHGNTAQCTATVTVEDNIAPTALCQDITVQLDGSGNASIVAADVDNGSSDTCGIASLALDIDAFTCADIGPITVTLTVEDNHGNTAQCTSTVTVEDNIAPTASCQPATVQLGAGGITTLAASAMDAGSTDNCDLQSVTVSPNTFTCADLGPQSVTLTVTDSSGNITTCTETATVVDNVPPVMACKDITVQLDSAGVATVLPSDIDDGTSDNCGITSLEINGGASLMLGCADVGALAVVLSASDAAGNIQVCLSTVTVEDGGDPLAVCRSITLPLDSEGMATVTAADVDDGSSDACSAVTIALTGGPVTFTCADLVTNPNVVTLEVTDGAGNVSTCLAEVTLTDPLSLCDPLTVVGMGDLEVTKALGEAHTFEVMVAGGNGPLMYQWYFEAAGDKALLPLSDGGSFAGTETAALTIDPVTYDTEGTYQCQVSDSSTTVPSDNFILLVATGVPLGGLFMLVLIAVLLAVPGLLAVRRGTLRATDTDR